MGKLVSLFRENIEQGLVCSFVAGLLNYVKHTLLATSRMDEMTVMTRARSVIKVEMTIKEPLATDTHAVKADILTTLTKCHANIFIRRLSGLNRYINIDL